MNFWGSKNTSGDSRSTGYAIVQRIGRAFSSRREYRHSRQLASQGNRSPTPPPDYDEDPPHETVLGDSVTGSHYNSISTSYWDSPDRVTSQTPGDNGSLISDEKGCQKCPCSRNVSCVLLILLFLGTGLVPVVVVLSMNEQSENLKGIQDIPACEHQYTMNISESRIIQCSLTNISIGMNETVFIRKTGMKDSEANKRIIIFQAENLKGNLIVNFTLEDADWSDWGSYSISLNDSNSIQDIHHFIIDIEGIPDIPACEDQYTVNISESRIIQCLLTNISIGVNNSVLMRRSGTQDSDTNTKKINFLAENLKGNVIVTFTLKDAVWADRGNYSISLNTSYSVHDLHHFVIAIKGIPDIPVCEDQYTMKISESRTIQCSLTDMSTGVNDTVLMRRTDMQDSQTRTTIPISRFEDLKGNLIVDFSFKDAVCSDRGNYSISLNTSNSVHDLHHFFIDIEDSPDTPRITKQPNTRGYIAGEVLHLQCKAIVGCSMKEFEIQRKLKITNNYQTLTEGMGNYTAAKTEFDELEITLKFNSTVTDQSDGDVFFCGVQGTKITSEAYTVSTVPVDFCQNRTINCDYRHPTRCDMWVICQTKAHPTIQRCDPSFYYRPATDCICCVDHECVNPDDAQCPYE